jgi:SprT protein
MNQDRLEQQTAAIATLEEQARQRTATLIARGQRLIGRALPLPKILFDLRGQTAGQVRIDARGRGTIRYNLALLLRHGEEFLGRTVPHEVAHYVTFLQHGRGIRPHGPEWSQIVLALGGDAERCHRYDTDGLRARNTRWFSYYCRCGEQRLSSIRHNRIARGTRYRCRLCGEFLRSGTGSQTGA